MIFRFKNSLSLPLFLFTAFTILSTSEMFAQESRFGVPDSLQNKTSEELIKYVKNAALGEAVFYENVVLNSNIEDIDVELYRHLGMRFCAEENYEKSHKYFDLVLDAAKKTKNRELLAKVSILKGRAYLLDGDSKKGFDFYSDGSNISKEEGFYDLEVSANAGLMVLYSDMGQYSKAIEISRVSLKAIEKSSFRNKIDHVRLLTTVNEAFLDIEAYDSVLHYADIGIRIGKPLDFKKGLLDLYIKKGIAYCYKKEYKRSLEYLFKAEDILEHNVLENSFHQRVNTSYFLARCYYETKSYDKARKILHSLIDQIDEEDYNKLSVIQSFLLLADCYKQNNDFEKASHYQDAYTRLYQQYQKNKEHTVNRVFEIETKKWERKHNKEQEFKKYTLIVGICVFLAFMALIMVYYRRQKNNKIVFNDLIKKVNDFEAQEALKNISPNEKSKEVIIDDDTVVDILKRLDKLEQQEFFLRLDCNLRSIAKKIKTNATYLSKIINTHKEKSFNDYINDLRIEYALKRLKNDRKFRSFSIKSIATEIGYKSDYSFAKHFKTKTGLNPSYYIKNLEVIKKNND